MKDLQWNNKDPYFECENSLALSWETGRKNVFSSKEWDIDVQDEE